MNIVEILSILVVSSVACNVCDFLFIRGSVIFHVPNSGVLGRVLKAWIVLMLLSALLCLIGSIPDIVLIGTGAAYVVFLQGYTIVFRHRQMKNSL